MRNWIGLAGACTLIATAAAAAGPALETDVATLDGAVRCPVSFTGSLEPLLLVHGTGNTEDEWALTYEQVLPDLGFDVCTVRLPAFALTDIQTSTEYVVHAVRTIATASGGPVDVIGFSQGGLQPRWAIKWWSDIRTLVDDLVTLASPHHGSERSAAECSVGSCDAALWQMIQDSDFLSALNDGDDTPGAVDYTSIYSQDDDQPPGRSILSGASNIRVQDVCSGSLIHTMHPIDAVVFAVALDALTNDGPAVPDRIDTGVCQEDYLPGMSEDEAAEAHAAITENVPAAFASHPNVNSEPPLRPYALPEPSPVLGLAAAGGALALSSRRRRSD